MKIVDEKPPTAPPTRVKWAMAFGIYCACSGAAYFVQRAFMSLGMNADDALGFGVVTAFALGVYLYRLFVLER